MDSSPRCSAVSTAEPELERVEVWRRHFQISNDLIRCTLCEFFCTMMFMFFGFSVLAQYTLSEKTSNEYVCVALGWGFAIVLCSMMGQRISGASMNPAVSLMQVTRGRLTWKRFFYYAAAQNLGAFCGAMLTFFVYYDAIKAYDRTTSETLKAAKLFATYPAPHLSFAGSLVDQVIGTAVLCICISIITDTRGDIPRRAQPACLGVMYALINMAFVHNCGCAINPARDFGPRVFTLMAGYGWKVFSYNDYKWFWVPILGPMLGGIIGGWAYSFFIGFHQPENKDRIFERLRDNFAEQLEKRPSLPASFDNPFISTTMTDRRPSLYI